MFIRLVKFFLVLQFPLLSVAQVTVDSLERIMNEVQGEEQLRLMITIGNMYATIDPEKGLEYGLKAAFLSKRMEIPAFEGQSLLLMGLSSLKLDQPENALRYYNRALTHSEKLNQRNEQILALEGIANVYDYVRNHNMAISYLERALILAQQLNKRKLQIEIHQRIGGIALNQNDFSLAYRQFSLVLILLGDDDKLDKVGLLTKASVLRQLGVAYRNLGQFNESIDVYRKASFIEESLKNYTRQMNDLYEMATSYFLMQQLDSALLYYNMVLGFNQLQFDSTSMVGVLQSIGDVFFEKGQFRQAVANYNQGYEFAQKGGNLQAQITALVSISRCYNEFNDYPSSKEYLNKALQIANSENLTSSAADVYKYLSIVHEAEGKYMQALEFYKLWSEIRDSIYTEESGQKLAKMQILYDISQKERENEILRQNSEIQNLQLTKSRYQRMIFIALALFLFALLVLLGFFYSAKQREFNKQKETELRIVDMNKELEKRMIAEIKKQEKQQLLLAQKSKLESLGTLAAGIAHEINQPLGGISMGIDNILIKLSENNASENYLKEKLSLLFENVDRIKRIIDQVRTFSRTQKPVNFEKLDINLPISNAISMVKTQYANHNISLNVKLDENIESVIGDKYKLEQVVLNLISNAKYAVDEKEKNLNLTGYKKVIEVLSGEDQDNVFFSVWDNGTGIKQKDIEKIFDPFFTTKKEDKGTGLGLSISYGFIKDFLGEIRVESQEGEFTRFLVVIPKT